METPQADGIGVVGENHHHQHQDGSSTPPPPPLSPPMSPESAAAAAAAAIANARWTPTKEQIAILEGLYQQGVRTPSSEQIQQIAGRLREHGHIEGKNVFYWFQNHKARQRQKEKQQSFAYFTNLLRRPPPLPILHMPPTRPFPAPLQRLMPPPPPPPPPPPQPACNREVVYRSPCYMRAPAPQAAVNAAYYQQTQTQTQMPVLHQRVEVAHDKVPAQAPPVTMYRAAAPNDARNQLRATHRPRETLELFPLQPTFMLPPDKASRSGSASALPAPSAPKVYYTGEPGTCEGPNGEAVPFYDFLGINSEGR